MIRLQRSLRVGRVRSVSLRLGGVVLSLVIAGIVMQIAGRDAIDLGRQAIDGTFTQFGREQTLLIATPIMLTALAVGLGFRIRVWNIGVEGQLYVGALAATGIGLHMSGPTALVLVVMMLAGAGAGALWVLLPAVARAYGNVNEIITTLLLNFVAFQLVAWFSLGVWRDHATEGALLSATPRVAATLPKLPGTLTLTIGVLAPFVLALVMFVVFRWMRSGYEIDMTGGNPRAATYAGISVRRRIIWVMCLSGAIAGLSGAILIAGTVHRLSGTISNQYGFSGFIVAALAGGAIVAILVIGILIGALLHAAINLQTAGLSVNTALALYGLILLVNGIAEAAARYRIVRVRDARPSPPASADDVGLPVGAHQMANDGSS